MPSNEIFIKSGAIDDLLLGKPQACLATATQAILGNVSIIRYLMQIIRQKTADREVAPLNIVKHGFAHVISNQIPIQYNTNSNTACVYTKYTS